MGLARAPYRGPGPGRPTDLALPPDRLPLLRSGRQRKQWRYVGVFDSNVMACVGLARIGLATTSWWAVWDRRAQALHERTRFRRAGVALEPGRVRVRDRDVEIDLALDEADGVEVVVADGRGYTWTRKQAGIRTRGTIAAGGTRHAIDAPVAVVDDSAGYHPRATSWWWSAGVGVAGDGRRVAWNLVDGINDPPRGSERTLWLEGEPREVGPNRFAADLTSVSFAEGGGLSFASEAVRERHDNLVVLRSRYRQPFGTFAGTLPDGAELREGFGVMERHVARW